MRRPAFVQLTVTVTILLSALQGADAITESEQEPMSIQRFVAADNVCAWPNLTVLGDGTIVAIWEAPELVK